MKILQVIPFFCPQMGGTVDYVFNLVKHLLTRGHEVTIFTTDDEFDPKYADLVFPARVVAFPSRWGRFRYSPSMNDALAKEISEYDVVHLNNYWSYQNILAARCALKHNVPYFLSPHGSLPIMMRGYAKKIFFELFFGRRILKNAAKVIAVSDMERKQILNRKLPSSKIAVIPNAIDLSLIKPNSGNIFRKRCNIRENEKIILFLGRIHKIKGLDLLIQAFAQLAEKRNDIRLVIVGPDEDNNYLVKIKKQIESRKIRDKVLFPGPLYDGDKYSAYTEADIYVLPSRYEIFAIAVLEACACGTPVIVTEKQGIAAYVKGRVGEVVPFDKQALSSAIDKLLSDQQLRQKYGRAGKELVSKYFTWDKIVKLYEELYSEAINSYG